jgi:ribosomal protein L11 methyltransferase|tara:strand:+ start:2292 stop:3257 length:966 start_codon:yes stop_codon:yes gene_type:complete
MSSLEKDNKPWIELSIESDSESVEAISEIFTRFGINGIAIEEIELTDELLIGPQNLRLTHALVIKTYIPDDYNAVNIKNSITSALHYLAMIKPLNKLKEKIVYENDWAESLKANFHTHKIGERITIVPSWIDYNQEENEIVINLDPGMAFGTGLHPTTQLCLTQVERWLKPNDSVFDFGTGSGILSIASARLGAKSIVAMDMDPLAIKTAEENMSTNTCDDLVTLIEGSSPDYLLEFNKKDSSIDSEFDLVLANVTADVILNLAKPLTRSIKNDGLLIGSGILTERFTEACYALMDEGLVLVDVVSQEDWRAVIMKKRLPQ